MLHPSNSFSQSLKTQLAQKQTIKGFHRSDSLSKTQYQFNNNHKSNSDICKTLPLVYSSLSKPQLMDEILSNNSQNKQEFEPRFHSIKNNKTLNVDRNEKTSLISKQIIDIESNNDECETTKLFTLTNESEENQSYVINSNDSYA